MRGQVNGYDFATLPVASRCNSHSPRCSPADAYRKPGLLTRHHKPIGRLLVRFTRFLAEQPEKIRDLDELTAAIIRRWRNSMAFLNDKRPFTEIALLLHDDPRLQSGPVADELVRRIRRPKSTTQSYSRDKLHHIKVAARRTFRTALTRSEGRVNFFGVTPEEEGDTCD